MRRTVLLLTLSCSLLVSCQALKERMEKLGASHAPKTATGKTIVDAAKKATGEGDGSGSTSDGASQGSTAIGAGTSSDDTLVTVQAAGEDNGWTFSQTVAGEYGLSASQHGGRPRVLVDPACPTAFAVVGMQGSRWKVTFRGETWGGFDEVLDRAIWQPGLHARGHAISPDGKRLGFVAKRDGKEFYVIDGVEGPAGGPNQLGALVFSDDSKSYAYTFGKTGLVVDGEVVHEDGADNFDSQGGLGFASGTHELHYFRLKSQQHSADELSFQIVSGDRTHQGAIPPRHLDPAFLDDGTPYWYELVLEQGSGPSGKLVLMMDGEPLPGVGRLSDPDHGSRSHPGSPDLMAEVVGEGADLPLVGFYVIKDGQAGVFDIPEGIRDMARHIRQSSVRVAPDFSKIAYQTNDRFVVGDTVSPTYERVIELGFSSNGFCVGTAVQGGRVFMLVDGVELERGYEMNSGAKLFTSRLHDRITLYGSGKPFTGRVGPTGLVMDEQDLEGWTFPQLQPCEDGSTLFCMSTHYDKGKTSYAVMRDLERIEVADVVPVRNLSPSPDGSLVLWDGRVTTAKRAREAVFVNDTLLGHVTSFRDAVFGAGGHYAFSAQRHAEIGKTAKQAATVPPLLCVDGQFFEGLRVLQPGVWVGDTFHVLCARGEGDDAEVLMATYES